MKKLIIIFSAITLCASSLQAQVHREVEVTKAYVPTVSLHEKPLLEAQIIDTAYIKPDVDYSITPLSINSPLQTRPINPATVTYWEFNNPAIAQVKVGVGVPYSSLLQAYGATHNASVGYLAANIDHSGIYSAIENSFGQRVNATQALNSGALAGGLYLADRTLAADLSYSNDIFNNYAYEQSESPVIGYQSISTSLSFGDNFVDLSRFNFNVGFDYSHMWDRESNAENMVAMNAVAGKESTLGDIVAGVEYSHVNGDNGYKNSNFALGASLDRELSQWQLSLGLKYDFEKNTSGEASNSYHYFLPQVSFKTSEFRAVSPFAQISSEVIRNDFATLSSVNPYIGAALAYKSSVEYDLRAGIEGINSSSKLSYKLFVGYNIGVNSRYWGLNIIEDPSSQTDIYDSYFDLQLASLTTTSINLDMRYRPSALFTLSFDASYNSYGQDDNLEYINSNPTFEGNVGVRFSKRKFSAGLTGGFESTRHFSVRSFYSSGSTSFTSDEVELGAHFDLDAFMEWKQSDSMAIFIEGSNLFNSNLYPWPMYRGFGIGVMAGVKINFK